MPRAVCAAGALVCVLVCSTGTPLANEARPREVVAHETALLSVELKDNGQIRVTHSAIKPIVWRQPAASFDERLHAAPQASFPTDKAERVALVVRHPARHTPHVVPIRLARVPGGGDVVDPWTSGGLIWRVPWFGPGTSVAIVRVEPTPSATLSLWAPR